MAWHGHKTGGKRVAYLELRKRVLAASGGVCQIQTPGICTGRANTLDHIRPLAEGGSLLDPANCRAACKECNQDAGAKLGGRRLNESLRRHSRAW